MKPTAKVYSELQQVYDVFNAELFGGQLPDCILTLQREKTSYGYFSANRFGNKAGKQIDEIAMNPTYFAVVPLLEILQTVAHEMAHLWQQHFGEPGRGRYHNQEWGAKMEEIGLMPSATGKPGGRKTGDHMADYAIEGGRFLEVCKKLVTRGFLLSWFDRFPNQAAGTRLEATEAGHAYEPGFLEGLDLPEEVTNIPALQGGFALAPVTLVVGGKSNRSKYTCGCGFNVWGKPGLRLRCEDCKEAFKVTN